MKRIVIWHRCGMTELLDDDNSDQEDYAQRLSSIFKLNEVAIINTSDNTFITRPSDISGIQVSSSSGFDVGDLEQLENVKELSAEIDKTLVDEKSEGDKKDKTKKEEVEEEILTDM